MSLRAKIPAMGGSTGTSAPAFRGSMWKQWAAVIDKYVEHGGSADFPKALLETCGHTLQNQADLGGPVPSHKKVGRSFYVNREFRLRANL